MHLSSIHPSSTHIQQSEQSKKVSSKLFQQISYMNIITHHTKWTIQSFCTIYKEL